MDDGAASTLDGGVLHRARQVGLEPDRGLGLLEAHSRDRVGEGRLARATRPELRVVVGVVWRGWCGNARMDDEVRLSKI